MMSCLHPLASVHSAGNSCDAHLNRMAIYLMYIENACIEGNLVSVHLGGYGLMNVESK